MTPSSPPDEPDEMGREGLADEISDVIEQHGRGLDADAISATIEAVVDEFDDPEESDVISNAALERELRRYVDGRTGGLERAEILDLLEELAEDLRSGSLDPGIDVDREGGTNVVTLSFDCAYALQRTLPRLFDIRGFFIEARLGLTYLDDVRIRVHARPIDAVVELEGCVARTARNGFTVQVWQPSVENERFLRSLPGRMRDARL